MVSSQGTSQGQSDLDRRALPVSEVPVGHCDVYRCGNADRCHHWPTGCTHLHVDQ